MELRFRQLLAAVAFAALPTVAAAQQGATVSGRVTNEAGAPLANASVYLQGSNIGTLTKDDGAYSFAVPAARVNGQTATIGVRLIGYREASAEVTLSAGTIRHDFVLTSSPVQLQGVVVTALGQQKEKSQLGTAQQQLGAEELNSTHDQNFVNQLEGKVSGVTITGSGTQGGSTNIVIRGANSISGNNQPLYIVDGVAVSDRDLGGHPGGGTTLDGGWDFGSAISDLNSEDIASISILKGPNAAAIYGSRAANGVVVITTKKGRNSDGKIQTRLNTTYTWDKVGILPDYQNLYGQGAKGQFKYVDGNGGGIQDFNDQSFGPRLDGRLIDQFTGPQQPWVAHPDNVESFFNTGHTFAANLSASGGTDKANARLSVGAENTSGIVPNNFFQKFNGALTGGLKINDRLSTTASLHFSRNNGLNRPGTGYNSGIMEQFIWFGRQVDMNALRAGWDKYDANGRHFNWNQSYHSNPFWLQYGNRESDVRNRFIGSVAATYQLADWASATLRSGSDIYDFGIQQDVAPDNVSWAGAGLVNLNYQGGFTSYHANSNENNTSLLVQASKPVSTHLQLDGTVGYNKRYARFKRSSMTTDGLTVAGIYDVSNAAIPPQLDQYSELRQTNSVYGSASFTWDGWWTVEGTARNDWSSTLPKGNNSYFYPSVNTSIVLTDAIPSLKSNVLSYLKLRGSIAKVGNDADPYLLETTYEGQSTKFGSLPLYTMNDAIANKDLKPEETKSKEVGLEMSLFGDRASIDLSYYDKATTDQIFNITVAPTSGFTQKAINAGKITNKGFEALLNLTPIRTQGGFEWNTTFSYSRNRSNVAELYPGINTIVLGGTWYATTEARLNQPYGAIYGFSYLRDSTTGQLLLHDGLPQLGPQKVLGTVQPDWVGGWNNQFKFKNLSFGFLFDIHEGGSIYSVSNMFGTYTGVFANTIKGRENDWNDPGLVIKGIDDATNAPNTTTVTAEDYYQSLFPIHEAFTYDDSWIKLREVRFGIDLPSSITSRLRASSVSLAFVARNLWTHTNVPNIDPEFAYSTGNFQGMEFAALPTPKSFGLNVQITP
ncbi:MAG TPA: SusC/RagA family TonB-linked outer membrane protein [Gemmatimonadaceae bacterium]